ncbi:hypothetical protein OG271_04030 [Micromonospora rifamycinica]|uniref:hypothetical protein n=1 Tax=Micromonospora rifamycinica TaxID=291594 RepID=UPI002E2A4A52|nr:hypothetical protein [Micromonospora rifamycinica]
MARTDYWLTDGYGNKALVVGAEERDRWVPLGWAETTEPAGDDMVWMRHAGHGGHAQFAAGVVETWQSLGWEPSAPPEPVDVLHDDHLVDVTAPAAEPQTPASKAASGTPKEK